MNPHITTFFFYQMKVIVPNVEHSFILILIISNSTTLGIESNKHLYRLIKKIQNKTQITTTFHA